MARVVVFEAEAVAKAVDEDEAIKAVSLAKKIDRINRNAYLMKNISIAKIITSVLTMAALATLEATAAYLSTLNATSYRPRTTKRRLSLLEAIPVAHIEVRNALTPARTLYARTTTETTTIMSTPLTTNISPKSALLSA